MIYAHSNRISVVWYFGFIIHESDQTISIAMHDRLDRQGDWFPPSIGEYRTIEDHGRILRSLVINGKEYKVTNPQHIFSYPSFRTHKYANQ
jgi:hypothetical protein